jgi:hypothetical protein
MLRALRTALRGAFENVEIRVVDEEKYVEGMSAPKTEPAPEEARPERFQRAVAMLEAAKDRQVAFKDRIDEFFYYEPELSSAIGVRAKLPRGADFEALKPELEKAVVRFLDDRGLGDLVDRNYVGNTISVLASDGGTPI